MTRYDFTTQPNRLDQNTMKWHEAESNPELLELWVADMDFLPVPEIRDAVINYAETHIFGYPYPSEELYQSIINWEKNQHGYAVDKESIVLIEGVVPAISTAIQAFTKEGDAVLINTPVYPPFARSVRLNNRQLIENSLRLMAISKLILNNWNVISSRMMLNFMFSVAHITQVGVSGLKKN